MTPIFATLLLAAFASLADAKIWDDKPPSPDRVMKMSDLQPIRFETDEDCHPANVDLYFVVDKSGSIGIDNWAIVEKFLHDLAAEMELRPGFANQTQIGMVEFDRNGILLWNLKAYSNQDPTVLLDHLSHLHYSFGQTNIAAGMNMATQHFTTMDGVRAGNDKVMVVLTDGHDNSDVEAARIAAQAKVRAGNDKVMVVLTDGHDNSDVEAARIAAQAKDIKIIAIGVGTEVHVPQLIQATGDAALVYDVRTFNNLVNITGQVCQDVADPCDGNPCENGGTCTSNGDKFTCNCTKGFYGPQCELSDDPCVLSRCENGGTCVGDSSPSKYHCICPPGYEGPNCQYPYCSGHGDFSCECPIGFTGPICQTPVNNCNQTLVIHNGAEENLEFCGEGGDCHFDVVHGSTCICHPGFFGPFCFNETDNCASNPCAHGGTCETIRASLDFICHCPPEFIGTRCQNVTDFCNIIVPDNGTNRIVPYCGEHGDCNNFNGLRCFCQEGWTGDRCQTEIKANCTWTNSDGVQATYPHGATWLDDCNECRCEYGVPECAHSLWCPHRCAIYHTSQVDAAGIPVGCDRPHENCIPDSVDCAAPNPTCPYPVGWCFPAGHVMVDDITFPTNPPRGFQTFKPNF